MSKRTKFTIEIIVDVDADADDIVDGVLDNGALQDALAERATDLHGAELIVESCVITNAQSLCDDEGPCGNFPGCSCNNPRGMTAYERQERSGDAY